VPALRVAAILLLLVRLHRGFLLFSLQVQVEADGIPPDWLADREVLVV